MTASATPTPAESAAKSAPRLRLTPDAIALGVPEMCALFTCSRWQFYALLKRYPADCATPFPGSVRLCGPGSQRKWDRDEATAWWRSLPREAHPARRPSAA